jgi:hypothetical protein
VTTPIVRFGHKLEDWTEDSDVDDGLAEFGSVRSKAVLGGLHHEYSLAPA